MNKKITKVRLIEIFGTLKNACRELDDVSMPTMNDWVENDAITEVSRNIHHYGVNFHDILIKKGINPIDLSDL